MGSPLASPFASVTASGFDPQLLAGEEAAGPTDAALDLVEDEQRAVLVGERPRGGEELRGRGVNPALALNRLDEDRGHLRPDRVRERVDVVQAHETRGGREGLPRRALGRLAGDGEGAVRAAVEGALERHDDRPSARLPRPLQRRLDRLGARVAEEGPRAAQALREQARQAEHGLVRVEVRDVPELLELARAAASGAGWPCPSETTAIPPSRSR